MHRTIRVQVLYSQRCPNLTPTIDLIERIGSAVGVAVTVESVLVTSLEEAAKLRCLGSPTVQVNGIDIEPAASESLAFALG